MSAPRAWEFLIGAALAVSRLPASTNIHLRNIGYIVGAILILAPAFGLRPASVFPGFNALSPCLGAAVFIWTGLARPPSTPWLLRPLKFFGNISYSFYLWHWPAFAFYRFSKANLDVSSADGMVLFIATTVIPFGSWIYIEEPFRRQRWKLGFRNAIAATLVLAGATLLTDFVSRPSNASVARLDAFARFDETAYRGGSCFQNRQRAD